MNIRKFDYFLTVADLGSFSRAAASLHLSQPVLSRQVRKLEEELGLTLFYRNGRGVTLTQAGHCLVKNARAVQGAIDATMTELSALKGQFAGVAAIGMPSSVGRVLTMPLVRHVREHFPGVKLHIVEGFSGDIVERLHHGRLDVAVIYTALSGQGIVADPIAVERLVLVSAAGTAPAGPVTIEQALALPLVLPGPMHTLRMELERIARGNGQQLDLSIEVDSLDSIFRMVQSGFGHTLLPPSAMASNPHAGLVATDVDSDLLNRTIYLASGPQRSNAVPSGRLASLMRNQILDLAGPRTWRAIDR